VSEIIKSHSEIVRKFAGTTTLEKVREFHTIYAQPIRTNRSLRVDEKQLRLDLIVEEVRELAEAVAAHDYVEIFDALGDIDYVAQGAVLTFGLDLSKAYPKFRDGSKVSNLTEEVAFLADALDRENISDVEDSLAAISTIVHMMSATFGVDLDDIVAIIHYSNLTKLGADGKPIYNSAGKVIKGPNYVPPTKGIEAYLTQKGIGQDRV
jgi:predicted HAD superfamily Cof-like phosphohydrolase